MGVSPIKKTSSSTKYLDDHLQGWMLTSHFIHTERRWNWVFRNVQKNCRYLSTNLLENESHPSQIAWKGFTRFYERTLLRFRLKLHAYARRKKKKRGAGTWLWLRQTSIFRKRGQQNLERRWETCFSIYNYSSSAMTREIADRRINFLDSLLF